MEKQSRKARSHLFTIRMWEEEIGLDTTEWRGKVQLVSSGEVRYFREWTTLIPLLQIMLSQVEPDQSDRQEAE